MATPHTSAPSPLAPKTYPDLPAIDGVRFATGAAGIRYKGRTDVMLALFDKGTQGRGRLHPLEMSFRAGRLVPRAAQVRARRGRSSSIPAMPMPSPARRAPSGEIHRVARRGQATGAPIGEIFLASTGVIGEPLDATEIRRPVSTSSSLPPTPDGLLAAAKAIMTTDTYPKVATRHGAIGGVEVTITGIAKGAGMIAPDMATMLSFVFTDAPIGPRPCRRCCAKAVERSFNAITVDSDTSTSDTLLALRDRRAAARGAPKIASAATGASNAFKKALDSVLLDLAHQVVQDGEGARKFVEITVEGAASKSAAKSDRLLDRQFAAGQDGDRRRRRQLGPRRHGRRQGRRAGRPRPACDLVRRHPRRA